MKIKYLSGPKSGIVEHVNNTIGSTLVAAGLAEHIPYKNYIERLSETAREGSDVSNVNPPSVTGTVWEVTTAPRSGKVILLRKTGFETARIETVEQAAAVGAPQNVVKQFKAMLEAPVSELPQMLADAKRAAEENDRAARIREYATVNAARA